jgi:FdhD protein
VRVEPIQVQRVSGENVAPPSEDLLAVEEPLQIRIEGRPAAITMRTPGDDLDLVAGFLYTEGVIDGADDLVALAHVDSPLDPQGNTVDVLLASGISRERRALAERALFSSSACGICGQASIDRIRKSMPSVGSDFSVPHAVLHRLPSLLSAAQSVFDQTGGLHAAALFSADGVLEVLREDIGRHNAVDKVIGWRMRQDQVPITDRVLLVSGRAGFEIVQKAAMAGIPVLAAVGAPSSLAASLAAEVGMTLIGFLRDGRYNRYGGPIRSR